MQHPLTTLRPAHPDELPRLREIEQAAAALFATAGLPEVAQADPLPLETLRNQQQAGRLFVAVTPEDVPVGFVVMTVIDGAAHLHELDVHPAHARQGIGTRLVEHGCAWAAQQGYPAVTLSTFQHIPWNGPWYARLGFRVLSEAEHTPGLRNLRQQEAQAGLPIDQRVCMRRDLPG